MLRLLPIALLFSACSAPANQASTPAPAADFDLNATVIETPRADGAALETELRRELDGIRFSRLRT